MLSYSLDAYEWQYVDDLYGNQRVLVLANLFHEIAETVYESSSTKAASKT